MDIHKNDTVRVLSGKEKGKSGKVLAVLAATGRVRVEKLMTVKRHVKKGRSAANPEGGIIEKAGTIHASNVMVVCPKCQKPTRVKHVESAKRAGRRVRACKQCGEAWES
jgi:large subunit ribosomal protein L24